MNLWANLTLGGWDAYTVGFNFVCTRMDIYKSIKPEPLILAPVGSYNVLWSKPRPKILWCKCSSHLQSRIRYLLELLFGYLIESETTFPPCKGCQHLFKKDSLATLATLAVAWVGEAWGSFNSSRAGVSYASVYSFWYFSWWNDEVDGLDLVLQNYWWYTDAFLCGKQVFGSDGNASAFDTKTHFRQLLIGQNYGMLSATSNHPNPDYCRSFVVEFLHQSVNSEVDIFKLFMSFGYVSPLADGWGTSLLLSLFIRGSLLNPCLSLPPKGTRCLFWLRLPQKS